MTSNRPSVPAIAVPLLERELEQTMRDIRHYELRERDCWNDYERVNKLLREAWKKQGALLEALRGV